MTLADLLKETVDVDCDEVWENAGVRVHSMSLSLREVVAVFDVLGGDRSHGVGWNLIHLLVRHSGLNFPRAWSMSVGGTSGLRIYDRLSHSSATDRFRNTVRRASIETDNTLSAWIHVDDNALRTP